MAGPYSDKRIPRWVSPSGSLRLLSCEALPSPLALLITVACPLQDPTMKAR
jgi:hypothetical protein